MKDLAIPFDVDLVTSDVDERRVWFEAFLRVPGSTVSLTEWASLNPTDKVALMRAGVRVEAERLLKLGKAVQGGVELADAISEVDGGALRDTMMLTRAVDKAARRLGGHGAAVA